MTFDFALKIDEMIRELMSKLRVPFVRIQVEDLQERFEVVRDAIIKRWPDLKLS